MFFKQINNFWMLQVGNTVFGPTRNVWTNSNEITNTISSIPEIIPTRTSLRFDLKKPNKCFLNLYAFAPLHFSQKRKHQNTPLVAGLVETKKEFHAVGINIVTLSSFFEGNLPNLWGPPRPNHHWKTTAGAAVMHSNSNCI